MSSFNGSEKATVTGTMPVGTLQVCLYPIIDVGAGASAGQTVDVQITSSSDISISSGLLGGSFPLSLAGTTTLQIANQNPYSPTSLAQKKIDDSAISTGAWLAVRDIKYSAMVSDPDGNQVQLCVEKDPLGTAFSNIEDACGLLVTSGSSANLTISTQTDDTG